LPATVAPPDDPQLAVQPDGQHTLGIVEQELNLQLAAPVAHPPLQAVLLDQFDGQFTQSQRDSRKHERPHQKHILP
jgi:hypothetical protein